MGLSELAQKEMLREKAQKELEKENNGGSDHDFDDGVNSPLKMGIGIQNNDSEEIIFKEGENLIPNMGQKVRASKSNGDIDVLARNTTPQPGYAGLGEYRDEDNPENKLFEKMSGLERGCVTGRNKQKGVGFGFTSGSNFGFGGNFNEDDGKTPKG